MGLVKFNNTTVNVENVPDGSEILSSAEAMELRQAKNSLVLLKSYIPVGVSESQIPDLLAKGQRFDSVNNQLTSTTTKVTELQTELGKFSNMPKDFSVDKWNSDRAQEKVIARKAKLDSLTEQVYAKVKKDLNVEPEKVDPRFISADVMANFNVDAQNAVDEWYKILDNALTEQQNFGKSLLERQIGSPVAGAPAQQQQGDPRTIQMRDSVSDSKVTVTRL